MAVRVYVDCWVRASKWLPSRREFRNLRMEGISAWSTSHVCTRFKGFRRFTTSCDASTRVCVCVCLFVCFSKYRCTYIHAHIHAEVRSHMGTRQESPRAMSHKVPKPKPKPCNPTPEDPSLASCPPAKVGLPFFLCQLSIAQLAPEFGRAEIEVSGSQSACPQLWVWGCRDCNYLHRVNTLISEETHCPEGTLIWKA